MPYLHAKTAPPLILIHGFLGSETDWDPFIQHLPESFTCYKAILPGHSHKPYSPTFDDLENWISSLRLPSFCLMGYSLGGRLALQLHKRFVKETKALVVVGSHFGLSSDKEKQQRALEDLKWIKLLKKDYSLFLEKWYEQEVFSSLQSNPLLKAEIIKKRKTQDPELLALSFEENSLAHQPLIIPEVPCLALYGEQDTKFKSYYASISSQINLYEISHAGHTVHLENAKQLADVTSTFLRNIL